MKTYDFFFLITFGNFISRWKIQLNPSLLFRYSLLFLIFVKFSPERSRSAPPKLYTPAKNTSLKRDTRMQSHSGVVEETARRIIYECEALARKRFQLIGSTPFRRTSRLLDLCCERTRFTWYGSRRLSTVGLKAYTRIFPAFYSICFCVVSFFLFTFSTDSLNKKS